MAGKLLPSNLLAPAPGPSPSAVLDKLSEELTESTHSLIEGESRLSPADSYDRGLNYTFYISAPALAVRATAFTLKAAPAGLPIQFESRHASRRDCKTLEELEDCVRDAFAGGELKLIVQNLYAESLRRGNPFYLIENGRWIDDAVSEEAAVEIAKGRARRGSRIDIYKMPAPTPCNAVTWNFGDPEPQATISHNLPAPATTPSPTAPWDTTPP